MEYNTNKNRLLWLDCLKTFATFLIVLQHSISYEWVRLLNDTNATWKIINFLFLISKSGVPIFIMCSGIGMLQKERSLKDIFIKNIFCILRCYACWMLFYGAYHVYSLFNQDLATIRTVINAIIKDIIFGQYHTWYIATLIGLYLITPFLLLLVNNKILTQYFLILSFIFTILFPYIGHYESLNRLYTVINDTNMKFVVGYPLYYVLGYYISNIELSKKSKILIPAFLLFSILLAFLSSCKYAVTQGADCQNIYTDFSVLGFAISVCILLLFRIIFENDSPHTNLYEHYQSFKKAVASLSYYGIGIYLVHPLFLFLITDLQGLLCIGGSFLLWFISFLTVKIISFLPIRTWFLGK